MKTIYEDEKFTAFLKETPAIAGHICLTPKEHFTILEQVSDDLVEGMGVLLNKLSIAAFERMGAHGTNIIIQNGIAAGQSSSHFTANIIPRKENDGLNFQWKTIKMNEDVLKETAKLLEKGQGAVTFEEPQKGKEVNLDKYKKTEVVSDGDEMNYLIKQLERLP